MSFYDRVCFDNDFSIAEADRIYNYYHRFLNYILNFLDKLGKIYLPTKFYQFYAEYADADW